MSATTRGGKIYRCELCGLGCAYETPQFLQLCGECRAQRPRMDGEDSMFTRAERESLIARYNAGDLRVVGEMRARLNGEEVRT